MTKCKVCHNHYNQKLRQYCNICGASNPALSRIVGRVFNRSMVEMR